MDTKIKTFLSRTLRFLGRLALCLLIIFSLLGLIISVTPKVEINMTNIWAFFGTIFLIILVSFLVGYDIALMWITFYFGIVKGWIKK